MSEFVVAAYHSAYLPPAGSGIEAIVWIHRSAIDNRAVDVSLRLWTPLGATLSVLREVVPARRDLRDSEIRLDDRTVQCPAGRWTGSGARGYELGVAVPPRDIGDELLAARVVVVAAGAVVGGALVTATWTDDERLVTASTATAVEAARSAGVAAADLPTGRSRRSAHTTSGERHAVRPCPGCGLPPEEGDRFCEACGRELAVPLR